MKARSGPGHSAGKTYWNGLLVTGKRPMGSTRPLLPSAQSGPSLGGTGHPEARRSSQGKLTAVTHPG